MSNSAVQLFETIPWFAWIAIIAIIFGSISGIFQMRYKHLERIEMIRQGMNPDGGKPAGPPDV